MTDSRISISENELDAKVNVLNSELEIKPIRGSSFPMEKKAVMESTSAKENFSEEMDWIENVTVMKSTASKENLSVEMDEIENVLVMESTAYKDEIPNRRKSITKFIPEEIYSSCFEEASQSVDILLNDRGYFNFEAKFNTKSSCCVINNELKYKCSEIEINCSIEFPRQPVKYNTEIELCSYTKFNRYMDKYDRKDGEWILTPKLLYGKDIILDVVGDAGKHYSTKSYCEIKRGECRQKPIELTLTDAPDSTVPFHERDGGFLLEMIRSQIFYSFLILRQIEDNGKVIHNYILYSFSWSLYFYWKRILFDFKIIMWENISNEENLNFGDKYFSGTAANFAQFHTRQDKSTGEIIIDRPPTDTMGRSGDELNQLLIELLKKSRKKN